MPILIPTSPESALAQGDFLTNLRFYETGTDGAPVEQTGNGLVLSRDCVALRAESVLVVSVQDYTAQVPDPEASFDDFRRYLQAIRDGYGAPDQFYLGNISGNETRYCARFDFICSICVPQGPEERAHWIAKHRVARLEEQFIRALPVRIFNAIARVGYDDHKWFPDADMTWLLSQGEKHRAKAEAELADAKTQLQNAMAVDPQNAQKIASLQQKVTKSEEKLGKVSEKIAPYAVESERRNL